MRTLVAEVIVPTRCVRCRRHPADPRCGCALDVQAGDDRVIAGLDRVLTACVYEDAARRLVLDLKMRGRRDAAAPLVRAMASTIHCMGLRGDLVTWVPGMRAAAAKRGFDHGELLARGVAKSSGLQIACLLRRTSGRDQAGLNRAERLENLKGAISARPCPGRGVVLVDDVVTTGATARSCGSALRAAGAATVELVAACRA